MVPVHEVQAPMPSRADGDGPRFDVIAAPSCSRAPANRVQALRGLFVVLEGRHKPLQGRAP